MIEWIFYVIILIIAGIAGWIIPKFTQDEMKEGRKWFIALFILSLVLGLFYLMAGQYQSMTILFALMIISGMSILKSKNK